MAVDFVGKKPVSEVIRDSGFTKFVIMNCGDHGHATPVFIYNEKGATNSQAVIRFEKWCDQVLAYNSRNENAYDITLFSDVFKEEKTEVEETDKGKKEEKKKITTNNNRIKFSFCLYNSMNGSEQPTHKETIIEKDHGDYLKKSDLEAVLLNIHKKQEENLILQKLTALEERIKEFEEEDDEEEDFELYPDEVNGEPEQKDWIGSIERLTDAFINIKDKISGISKPAEPKTEAAMSGEPAHVKKTNPEEYKKTEQKVRENFQLAISILLEHDKQLDEDLLKLADIAQAKPALFNEMILQMRAIDTSK